MKNINCVPLKDVRISVLRSKGHKLFAKVIYLVLWRCQPMKTELMACVLLGRVVGHRVVYSIKPKGLMLQIEAQCKILYNNAHCC